VAVFIERGNRGMIAVDPSTWAAAVARSVQEIPNLSLVLKKSEDSLWSTRRECFAQVRSLMSSQTRVLEVANGLESVVRCAITHLTDSHHKVASEAMECLAALVTRFTPSLEPLLEKILAQLFVRLGDKNVRDVANDVCRTVIEHYAPSVVLPVLLKVFHHQNQLPKVSERVARKRKVNHSLTDLLHFHSLHTDQVVLLATDARVGAESGKLLWHRCTYETLSHQALAAPAGKQATAAEERRLADDGRTSHE
jgi:hypothetical protein